MRCFSCLHVVFSNGKMFLGYFSWTLWTPKLKTLRCAPGGWMIRAGSLHTPLTASRELQRSQRVLSPRLIPQRSRVWRDTEEYRHLPANSRLAFAHVCHEAIAYQVDLAEKLHIATSWVRKLYGLGVLYSNSSPCFLLLASFIPVSGVDCICRTSLQIQVVADPLRIGILDLSTGFFVWRCNFQVFQFLTQLVQEGVKITSEAACFQNLKALRISFY